MRKELYKKIEIPEGVEVEIEGTAVKVTGPEGKNSRKFKINSMELKKEGNIISIGSKKATKKEKKLMNTTAAHIKNMILGVQKKFEYELKAVFSHFPISVEVKGHDVLIKNFLGEKIPRKAHVPAGVEIEVQGNLIKVRSADKELAGQTAADLETATRIRSRDRRIFQDGIFMIKKSGERYNAKYEIFKKKHGLPSETRKKKKKETGLEKAERKGQQDERKQERKAAPSKHRIQRKE